MIGHNFIKTTQVYAKVSNNRIVQDMKEVFEVDEGVPHGKKGGDAG